MQDQVSLATRSILLVSKMLPQSHPPSDLVWYSATATDHTETATLTILVYAVADTIRYSCK